jgi:hypothetical protein
VAVLEGTGTTAELTAATGTLVDDLDTGVVTGLATVMLHALSFNGCHWMQGLSPLILAHTGALVKLYYSTSRCSSIFMAAESRIGRTTATDML